MNVSEFRVTNKSKFKLNDIKTSYTGDFNSKEDAQKHLIKNIEQMSEMQSKLYAQGKYGILIIFQAMDTGGKDSAIKHVMSGLNPQGTKVYSFKEPSAEELSHDYLWKAHTHIPERGQIGIFNRSYYEELLVVRVHNLIKNQRIPEEFITDSIWEERFEQIKNFEKYLYENGIIPIKIFLHISKEEQKKRLLERINDKTKNWKFSESDIKERSHWDKYQQFYEEAIRETSSKSIPWFVVPADKKWFARLVISQIIIDKLEELKLEYPTLSKEQYDALEDCRKKLTEE
ncbi:polyphosphate kinase 2 family protein [Clostridium thailandense]|uniref:polyphosphate kinase 2 family protein n=1 Tax=Clostridium thailandense TaxID=2794346 RepID=UPI003989C72A